VTFSAEAPWSSRLYWLINVRTLPDRSGLFGNLMLGRALFNWTLTWRGLWWRRLA
jgi:hypothetical protein